jgi:hypothetical protein
MVNNQLYQDVLVRLRDAVHRKKPELWENETWVLHHNDALADTSLVICSYLAERQTSTAAYLPCSPDLAPAGFFLNPKLKTTLKGRCFQTIEDIQENVTNPMNSSCTCSVQWM